MEFVRSLMRNKLILGEYPRVPGMQVFGACTTWVRLGYINNLINWNFPILSRLVCCGEHVVKELSVTCKINHNIWEMIPTQKVKTIRVCFRSQFINLFSGAAMKELSDPWKTLFLTNMYCLCKHAYHQKRGEVREGYNNNAINSTIRIKTI